MPKLQQTNLVVRRVTEVDTEAVLCLLKCRGLISEQPRLPRLGFIVYQNAGEPVCAGWLREVEGGAYLFDSLISNKELNSEQRHQGMELLWRTVLKQAKGKYIIATSNDSGTIKRGLALGFKAMPHTLCEYKGN